MLGAEAMVAKRDAEIAMLEGLLRMTSAPAKQKVLTLRLLASIRNRNSWLDYLANGFQKETRAVITPPAKSKSKPTTH
jgi:hypothetical protein